MGIKDENDKIITIEVPAPVVVVASGASLTSMVDSLQATQDSINDLYRDLRFKNLGQ